MSDKRKSTTERREGEREKARGARDREDADSGQFLCVTPKQTHTS